MRSQKFDEFYSIENQGFQCSSCVLMGMQWQAMEIREQRLIDEMVMALKVHEASFGVNKEGLFHSKKSAM